MQYTTYMLLCRVFEILGIGILFFIVQMNSCVLTEINSKLNCVYLQQNLEDKKKYMLTGITLAHS